jgi:hypothetical protein
MGGEGTGAGSALQRLRARWLMPSPPLAVDDEADWRPSPDPAGDEAAGDGEADPPAVPIAR